MNRKHYWLYLAKIKGMESGRRRVLLEMFGSPEEIYRAGEETLKKIPLLEEFHVNQLLMSRRIDFEKELEEIEKKDIGFVTVDEEDFPEKLRDIPDTPPFLFYKGELPSPILPSVAIVGSRRCSIYGKEMCLKFSGRLAQAGIQIISGMAAGVDGFAHRGAISAGGKTIAVLGCGVDVCYPSENLDIYDTLSTPFWRGDKGKAETYDDQGSGFNNKNMISGTVQERICGGIVSEYYPGEKALPYHFPQRNRIISGLADILLVVEAGKKSGTFITVDHALEQGRDIFAIPGRIGDKVSDGCNCLIKNGASLASEPEDIIEELKKHYEILVAAEKKKKKSSELRLEEDEKKVYEALSGVPLQINEIGEITGVECGSLSRILTGLELKNLIEETGKNLYIKK